MELHGAHDATRQHHAPERLKKDLRASTTEQGEQVAVLRKQLRERQAAGEEQINGKEERWRGADKRQRGTLELHGLVLMQLLAQPRNLFVSERHRAVYAHDAARQHHAPERVKEHLRRASTTTEHGDNPICTCY